MRREKHLEVDRKIFNKEFPEVHKWIDGSFVKWQSYRHWTINHHLEAVIERFGSFTAQYNSAYFHILMDWISHFAIAVVPKDKTEVLRLLKSLGITYKGEEDALH